TRHFTGSKTAAGSPRSGAPRRTTGGRATTGSRPPAANNLPRKPTAGTRSSGRSTGFSGRREPDPFLAAERLGRGTRAGTRVVPGDRDRREHRPRDDAGRGARRGAAQAGQRDARARGDLSDEHGDARR